MDTLAKRSNFIVEGSSSSNSSVLPYNNDFYFYSGEMFSKNGKIYKAPFSGKNFSNANLKNQSSSNFAPINYQIGVILEVGNLYL